MHSAKYYMQKMQKYAKNMQKYAKNMHMHLSATGKQQMDMFCLHSAREPMKTLKQFRPGMQSGGNFINKLGFSIQSIWLIWIAKSESMIVYVLQWKTKSSWLNGGNIVV